MKQMTHAYAGKMKRQQGSWLLELGLALFVAALIGVPVYNRYVTNQERAAVNEEIQNVHELMGNIQDAYSGSEDYAGVDTNVLLTNNVIPKAMRKGTGTTNKYQGTIAAAVATLADSNDAVRITLTKYTQDACAGVLKKINSSIRQADVNGTPVKPLDAKLDIAALGTACAAGGNDNTVVVYVAKR